MEHSKVKLYVICISPDPFNLVCTTIRVYLFPPVRNGCYQTLHPVNWTFLDTFDAPVKGLVS